jgi:hypothetical protein
LSATCEEQSAEHSAAARAAHVTIALAETRTLQATFACTVHVAWQASLHWLWQVDWLSDAHCAAHVSVHCVSQKDAH